MKFDNLELNDVVCLIDKPYKPVVVRGIDHEEQTVKLCIKDPDIPFCRTMTKDEFEILNYVKDKWFSDWDKDVPIVWVDKECPDCGETMVECELPGCRGGYTCLNCDHTMPDGDY